MPEVPGVKHSELQHKPRRQVTPKQVFGDGDTPGEAPPKQTVPPAKDTVILSEKAIKVLRETRENASAQPIK